MHVHDSLNLTLCSRGRCGAREAMTVGCKPTTHTWLDDPRQFIFKRFVVFLNSCCVRLDVCIAHLAKSTDADTCHDVHTVLSDVFRSSFEANEDARGVQTL